VYVRFSTICALHARVYSNATCRLNYDACYICVLLGVFVEYLCVLFVEVCILYMCTMCVLRQHVCAYTVFYLWHMSRCIYHIYDMCWDVCAVLAKSRCVYCTCHRFVEIYRVMCTWCIIYVYYCMYYAYRVHIKIEVCLLHV